MKHLYTDSQDTVIAENLKDANRRWEEEVGDIHDSFNYPWKRIKDDEWVTILFEDMLKEEYLPQGYFLKGTEEGDFKVSITAKAKDWVESKHCAGEVIVCTTGW